MYVIEVWVPNLNLVCSVAKFETSALNDSKYMYLEHTRYIVIVLLVSQSSNAIVLLTKVKHFYLQTKQ